MPNLITVTEEYNNTRIDAFISAVSQEGLSRSAVQNLCEAGNVLYNGAVAAKNLKVKSGGVVEYIIPEPVKLDAFPENRPLHIIYEDKHLIVVNKEQGMVVHPAAGNPNGTLVNALLYHCEGGLSSINGVIRPGIVHRIDKDTSGLLVVAKDDITHEGLSLQFSEHSLDRFYYAVVHGRLKDDSGRIEAPIGRHPVDRKKMCVTNSNSRFAATNYQVIERYNNFTLVKLKLETGRTHQIRVHMAYIGHPVAGDRVYGPAKFVKELNGQCLHAAVLGFIHPVTKEHLVFESQLPDYFESFVNKLRRSV